MSIDKIKEQLKNNSFSQIYLFYGEEVLLKEHYIKKIKEKMIPPHIEGFNYYIFSKDSLDNSNIEDAIESLPVMSDYKLIYIKDSELFKNAKHSDSDFWVRIMNDLPEYIHIIFDEKDVDKRNIIYKTVKKIGLFHEFKKDKLYDLINWTGRLAATYGRKITKENIRYLLENCDNGMINIKNEIIKLCSYCHDKDEITKNDIDNVCTKSIESKVFSLMDAIAQKDFKQVYSLLKDMKTLKESVIKIIAILAKQFSQILKVKLLIKKGESNAQIAKLVGIPPFAVRKYAKFSNKFSYNFLNSIIIKCSKTDIDIKNGKINDWVGLEILVFEINSK